VPTEAAMLQQYDVSRGTLREALRILEVHGLITIKPGPSGGPRIADLSANDFARTATFYYEAMGATFGHLVETRLLVEPIMARLAAEKRTPEDIEAIRDVVSLAKVARDVGESLGLSMEFHELIGRICANPVLAMFDSSMSEVFEMYSLNKLPQTEDHLHVRSHEKIAQAVIEGDQDRAEAAMRKHLQEFARDFRERNTDAVNRVVDWI
jgi:GntR family transcriptional regulator, transcriptional repressor for pyruvate dehydrogenase complex